MSSVTDLVPPVPGEPDPAGPAAARPELPPDLAGAADAVFAAAASWLQVTWEQPILRAMSSNAGRSLDNAAAFPALRAALVALQADARALAERTVAPLLDPDPPMRDQAIISNVDAALLELVGLIGTPLKEAGFDPLSGGLDRIQDGFRLKSMTEHDAISAALRQYNDLKAAHAAERAAAAELERERARAEVERLWQATAPKD